ncbi:multidrug efflux SMR transporter [Candidatus Babeliales bacterium]|nr:multidrug efflux SMR transporter [Candidatus Babeliales bacterium]
MNGWIYLILAGLCEIVWAVGLKFTNNFSKFIPSEVVIFTMCLSIIFLNFSLKTIPLSVSYTIWTGIGVVGTIIFGLLFFHETLNLLRLISLSLIILGIIGCKLSMG